MPKACLQKGEGALLLLSLFFASCASSQPVVWKEETVYCSIRSSHSSRLALAPENPAREMGIEFVLGPNNESLFLTSFCHEFPESLKNPGHLEVFVSFGGDEETVFLAKRMKGGQKLLIPKDKSRLLVKLLFENCSVTFRAGCLKTTVDPISFKTSYQHLFSKFH